MKVLPTLQAVWTGAATAVACWVDESTYMRGYENGFVQARMETHMEMLEAVQRGMTQAQWAEAELERDLRNHLVGRRS